MFKFKTKEELAEWISREVLTTGEALELLGCSRQNLHSYVKRGKLIPIKETERERLFFRSDVVTRKEEAEGYFKTDKETTE